MENTFTLKNTHKRLFIILVAIGLATLVAGIFIAKIESGRIWANILLNNILFVSIALFGTFFIVIHKLGDAAWHLSVQRIAEAMSTFIPVGGVLMLLILAGSHDLYHWTHTEHLDEILQGKTGYLNMPFFITRLVVYFTGWTVLARLIRKASVQLDIDADLNHLRKTQVYAGIFIVFFAITTSTAAWDWVMSIDTHWYSTLFGWYMFSSMFVSGVAVIILIALYLKKQGLMSFLNEEHMHDLGKYLFGFSIFWAYLWFSQFMLIWYSNIPEETVYYHERFSDHRTLFLINFGINFLFPFLALMTRGSKRIGTILGGTAVVCFIGHWLDFFIMIMPGVLHEKTTINWFEIGLTIGYIGIFLYVTFLALSKASLLPKNHPYLQETFDYDNIG